MLIPFPASPQKHVANQSASVPGSVTVTRPEADSTRLAGGWLGECVVPQRVISAEEANQIQTVGSNGTPPRPPLGWR